MADLIKKTPPAIAVCCHLFDHRLIIDSLLEWPADPILLIWLSELTCVIKLTQLSLNGNLDNREVSVSTTLSGTLTGRSVLITALSNVTRNGTQHYTELRSAFCPQVPRRLAVRWQHETNDRFAQEQLIPTLLWRLGRKPLTFQRSKQQRALSHRKSQSCALPDSSGSLHLVAERLYAEKKAMWCVSCPQRGPEFAGKTK